MSEAEQKPELHINAIGLSVDQLIKQLISAEPEARIILSGLSETQPGLLAGLNIPNEVLIKANVGTMAFMAGEGALIDVFGNAGLCCGHSLQSGSVLIRGDAGNYLAAYAVGGYLAVHGKAGDHVAYGLSGADILVRSRCGDRTAASMRSGTLVLGNGCGNDLGQGMTGGTIYVRGDIGSVAEGVQQGRMKETDTIRLSLMLVRAGIKTTYEKFLVFRVRGDRG
ncbi:MAG: hypothetical protein U0930_05925 [Pirellulales bacterium]